MAENKRVAVFFLVIIFFGALFVAWLMLYQPDPVQSEVTREIPNERILNN